MQKLILKNFHSPGDVVMLTAAVRDLHLNYPGEFQTDVRTACQELWENNPYVTRIRDRDPLARVIDCDCELINSSNDHPLHFVEAFTDCLNRVLNLKIRPTAFKGDLHLSPQEKMWYSQVHELAGVDLPYWILASGGKYDVTVKWWDPARYQAVIDYFQGRIQFVQIGEWGHWHPPLKGVIDLRGRTTLRQLVRLVYHAQGVLCPVTALMHLAAAIETKPGNPPNRPCVVIAGAREPVNWEAYPYHQYIHRNGALDCAQNGGCWKDRIRPLGDGDERDGQDHLCLQPMGHLPRCMDMISTAEVITRIETYFHGGVVRYLAPREVRAGKQAVRRAASNGYDQQPLNMQSARLLCDLFVRTIDPYPTRFKGRGIVIPAGGLRYLPAAWVCINLLRRLGCNLPIELWHLGEKELDPMTRRLLIPLGVTAVDAEKIRKLHPARRLQGWELKAYALRHSSFEEVMLLDADNVPIVNPSFLFETAEFKEHGAIFWPDYERNEKSDVIWHCLGVTRPAEREFESGQIVLDKERCWTALAVTHWLNENSDFFYHHFHGDKETFHLGFARAEKSYSLVPHPVKPLRATMCQHDFEGRRIFQHRNLDKWKYRGGNERIEGFLLEDECRKYLNEFRKLRQGKRIKSR